MSEQDLHYLRSILRNLREIQMRSRTSSGPSLGGEVLADNIDWLDCFIDKHSRNIMANAAKIEQLEARLRDAQGVIAEYEKDRLSNLGGIGSPA